MGPDSSAGHSARFTRARWRYRFVVGLIWVAVLAAAAAGWRYAKTSGPAYGPVILISIESLRADHLPVYGYTKVRTPAIDALAADSVAFDRAYAHSPLTLPSHVSMLSGLLPVQTGVRDEIGFPIPAGVSLLPQLLHRRGFKTGGVVSNDLLGKETGLGAAFGFFDDEPGAGGEGAPPGIVKAVRDGAESVKVAERWIETIGTARFFLFLHLDETGVSGPGRERFAKLSPYDARIAAADEQVGELVAFLKKRGLYSGGILVLTSDHGEGLGEHGEQGHGLFLYEPDVRTPLIVKLPRSDGGGRHSNALVQQIDIAPTVLDLMGAPRPSGLGGRSLRNLLDSPTATIPARRVYAESFAPRYRFGWGEVASLTDGRYRYIESARPELYDLLQDPRERTNLVETDAATAQAMRASLDAVMGHAPWPVPAPLAGPEQARLAAMGYLDDLPAVAPDLPGSRLPDVKDRIGVANKYWEATGLAARGRTAEAIAGYRDVLADDRSLAPAWDRLARLLVDAGQFREAGEALSTLLALYPDEARAAEADRRIGELLGATPTPGRYLVAIAAWKSIGDKAKAADLRASARKAVGEAALRKAEAAIGK
jgi:arylsulfatase A-like enzyme